MIVKGASGANAELPINLFDSVTGVPITGHAWAVGELWVALGNGAFASLTAPQLTRVVEKGRGKYAWQMSAAESATTGGVYIDLDTTNGYLPHSFADNVVDAAGVGPADIVVGQSGKDAEVPIDLFDTSGNPILNRVWVAGDVRIALAGAAFGNATIGNIVQKGRGHYALQLTNIESGTSGGIYLDIDTTALSVSLGVPIASWSWKGQISSVTGGGGGGAGKVVSLAPAAGQIGTVLETARWTPLVAVLEPGSGTKIHIVATRSNGAIPIEVYDETLYIGGFSPLFKDLSTLVATAPNPITSAPRWIASLLPAGGWQEPFTVAFSSKLEMAA